ncbi:hypothetical protein JW978_03825 [Candidatus Dojkabacteria bacterium]|nr:hypothetical protein [Candidatus Dojkabacteria bacterium]
MTETPGKFEEQLRDLKMGDLFPAQVSRRFDPPSISIPDDYPIPYCTHAEELWLRMAEKKRIDANTIPFWLNVDPGILPVPESFDPETYYPVLQKKGRGYGEKTSITLIDGTLYIATPPLYTFIDRINNPVTVYDPRAKIGKKEKYYPTGIKLVREFKLEDSIIIPNSDELIAELKAKLA